ncbi:MAG: SatD family protein [Eudoraea sp.]|nr:SatD family protein [Eudoraea sp.]
MIAIITGDVINSEAHSASKWVPSLKQYFSQLGETPRDWEIYRGDEFQLKLKPEQALKSAVRIKALIKSVRNLDIRLGIGLGDETFSGAGVSESNGTAYQRSGRIFSGLKERKLNLALASGNATYDRTLNLMLKLALDFMDDWSTVSAEIITLAMQQPKTSQKEIARQLNIQQSAVSQRLKRARWELVQDLLDYYSHSLNTLEP